MFLNTPPQRAAVLCGRHAVQLMTRTGDLASLAKRLEPAGSVTYQPPLLRFEPTGERLSLSVFADGRLIVHGTDDAGVARSVISRYLGDV